MIRSLQCMALTVPSIEQGAAFYKTMGLEGEARGDCMVFRCVGRDQDQLYLVPGHGVEGSSIVTAIARNGATTAIRVSGLGKQ